MRVWNLTMTCISFANVVYSLIEIFVVLGTTADTRMTTSYQMVTLSFGGLFFCVGLVDMIVEWVHNFRTMTWHKIKKIYRGWPIAGKVFSCVCWVVGLGLFTYSWGVWSWEDEDNKLVNCSYLLCFLAFSSSLIANDALQRRRTGVRDREYWEMGDMDRPSGEY